MKILQRANSKMLVLLTTLLLAFVTLFAGVNVSQAPKASAETTEMTYVETEVAAINVFRNSKYQILAFVLTESDYDDFDPVQDFDSRAPDFAEGTPKYNYITSLSYWKNFKDMNSAGGRFNQLFAYWNGGFNDSQIGSIGRNAVAHQTSITSLDYGLMIKIPAGTDFPSWEYAQTNCTSEPKAYRTTTDVAFYFNGATFEKIDYKVADQRDEAIAQVRSVDTSLYYAAEQGELDALMTSAIANINQCFNLTEIQIALADFNKALKEIKTIEDYAKLAAEKDKVKAEMVTYFNTFVESAYGTEEWALICEIKAETNTLIDAAESMAQVAEIIAGIQYKAEEILTEEEKPAFAEYIEEAMKSVEEAFVASLYREVEAAQGAALVEEGKTALENAKIYSEADAIELAYIAKIEALKTDAELTAEEEANKKEENKLPTLPEDIEIPTDNNGTDNDAKAGCFGSVAETLVVISIALAFTLVLILKNKKRMDI